MNFETSESGHSSVSGRITGERSKEAVVHIFEGMELSHGPLWLDFLLRALIDRVGRLIVTHPDTASYEVLAATWGGASGSGTAVFHLSF